MAGIRQHTSLVESRIFLLSDYMICIRSSSEGGSVFDTASYAQLHWSVHNCVCTCMCIYVYFHVWQLACKPWAYQTALMVPFLSLSLKLQEQESLLKCLLNGFRRGNLQKYPCRFLTLSFKHSACFKWERPKSDKLVLCHLPGLTCCSCVILPLESFWKGFVLSF